MKEKKYFVETWDSFKIITHPDNSKKGEKKKLKFKKGIKYGLEGITPDYDRPEILKEAFTNIFRKSGDMEPNAPEMEIDWMEKQNTIHIVFIYPNKNIHYFFKWWKEEN